MTSTHQDLSVSVQSVTTTVTTVTVGVAGRLDAARCPDLRAEFDRRLEANCHRLVCDLTEATFVDSVGLAALVKAMRDAHSNGAEFEIIRPRSDDAMRVFRLSKFDEVFTMRDSREAGVPT